MGTTPVFKLHFEYNRNKKSIDKNNLYNTIINSKQLNNQIKKEVQRVYKMANERIRRLEMSGVFSPALANYDFGNKKYTKFGWKESMEKANRSGEYNHKVLLQGYADAISFLQQPTSQVKYAREYNERVKAKLKISDEAWNKVVGQFINKGSMTAINKIRANAFYKNFLQDLYQEAQEVQNKIEMDSKQIADLNIKNIESKMHELSNDTVDLIDSFFDDMEDM